MLRCVFIGSKNDFDENLIHWLSQRTEIAGVVWTKSAMWQHSLKGKINFARRRKKQKGIIKTVDEILFYLYFHQFLERKSYKSFENEVIFPYRLSSNFQYWKGNSIESENVNDDATLNFLKDCIPDIVFAMCVNDYFGKKILKIPKLGVYLWHEGITPEYRGLYSPFWAIHNLDFKNVGYTLLKMDSKIDAGQIYVQGRSKEFDPFRQTHSYIGHKAIWDSLVDVDNFLLKLESGDAKPIIRTDSQDGYYTYPGITDFIRQRMRLSKIRKA